MRPKKGSNTIFSFLLAFAMLVNGRPLTDAHASPSADPSAAEITVLANTNHAPNPPVLNAPQDDATNVVTSPVLDVTVSDPDGDPLTVNFYGRSTSALPGENFTLVALPDTQVYSAFYPAYFTAQTQWVVANRSAWNIAFVTHSGDVTETPTNTSEWDNASAAMGILEDPQTTRLPDGIPYGIAPGNHDLRDGGLNYNVYFGVSRFKGRAYFGDHYGSNNFNHYELFSAGGMDFIILHLTNAPDASALAWAGARLSEFAKRRAIVVSHDIIGIGNPASFSGPGRAIYNALKVYPNLFLMLCGHIGGESMRADTYYGHTIYTLMSDYQEHDNGGDSWLRLLKFSPTENMIHVLTYSPALNQYETDADSLFDLSYAMEADGYQMLGSVRVASGAHARYTWYNLDSSATYDWYVSVNDGALTTQGPAWSFTTRWSNRAPVAADGTAATDENTPATFYLVASDPDGDSLIYTVITQPQHGILSGAAPELTYIPDENYFGKDVMAFTANDGRVNSNQATITITVHQVNAPVFASFLPLVLR